MMSASFPDEDNKKPKSNVSIIHISSDEESDGKSSERDVNHSDWYEIEEDYDEDFHLSQWISSDEIDELLALKGETGHYPMPKNWKDILYDMDGGIVVSVGKGSKETWNQAKDEFEAATMNLDRILKTNGERISMDAGMTQSKQVSQSYSFAFLTSSVVCDVVLGRESRLCYVMTATLGISVEVYWRFLATFFTAAKFGCSMSILMEEDYLVCPGMLSRTNYNHLSQLIAEQGCDVARATPLWRKMEDSFNELAKELFLEGACEKLGHTLIALDDDKCHYNWKSTTNMHTLKKAQHVKDNRRGVTCHMAMFTASGFPVNLLFEREQDTVASCFMRMSSDMFGQGNTQGLPNLTGITYASDHGYWTPDLLFNFVLKAGADVIGTIKRSPWFPFNYVEGKTSKKDASDPQLMTPKEGWKSMWHKSLKWQDSFLRAVSYCSGTGTSIAFAVSSIHHVTHWDLNVRFDKDTKWYNNKMLHTMECQSKAFNLIEKSISSGCIDTAEDVKLILKESMVKPLTTHQRDAAWFLLRSFSLASSTVNKVIKVMAPKIDKEHPL